MGVSIEPMWSLREAAKKLELSVDSMDEDLPRLLKHENPCIRVKVLGAMSFRRQDLPQWLPLISSQTHHPYLCVRWAALSLLTRIEGGSVAPILREYLRDPHRHVRAVAALELVRRGRVPPAKYLNDVLTRLCEFRYPPCRSVYASPGQVSQEAMYKAIAPHADRKVFTLLLQHPLWAHGSDPTAQAILRELGRSLTKHPEAAEVLLHACDEPYSSARAQFAQAVFRYAGKDLLPVVHRALADPDRVVRANAARACAAIGDRSSIPYLIAALRREAGLSCKTLVWALGELRAAAAVPDLVALLLDSQNVEKIRPRALSCQALPWHSDCRLLDVDHIGTEWSMLRADTDFLGGPYGQNAELVGPRGIVEAVNKMGPAAVQEFRVAVESTLGRFHDRRTALRLLERLSPGQD